VGGGDSVLGGDRRLSAPTLGAGHLVGGPWPTKTRWPALIKWVGPISMKKILFQLFQTTSSLQNTKVVPAPLQNFANFPFWKKFKFPTDVELKIQEANLL
jgi:hypothetical protein